MTKRHPIARVAPIAVMGAALSFSAWSLYYVARHMGAPLFVAVVVSTIYDGGAITLADLAMEHTREGDSGLGPRIMVFILAGLSAWLNTFHASLGHYPANSWALWASPPIVAVIVYEYTVRYIHRRTLRNLGVTPASMPRYGRVSWILFPIKTYKDVRKVTEYRRTITTSLATGRIMPGNPGTLPGNSQTFGANPATFGLNPGQSVPNPRDVRAWALATGLTRSKTGPLPADVTARYLHALSAGEIDGDGIPFKEYETDSIPHVNGHNHDSDSEAIEQ